MYVRTYVCMYVSNWMDGWMETWMYGMYLGFRFEAEEPEGSRKLIAIRRPGPRGSGFHGFAVKVQFANVEKRRVLWVELSYVQQLFVTARLIEP